MAQKRTVQVNQKAARSRQGQIELFPVDGNTVRQADPLEREHSEQLRRRREAWEEEERAQRAARRVRRNRIRELRMNRIYVAFLTVCVAAVFGICFMYIQLQSQATEYKENIAALQTEVNDLEADNEELLQNIETSVDLSEVMDRAMNELGMTYPTSDQIITYETDSSDSLTQYADVTSSSGSSLFSAIFGN